jgi:hypothetical protein
MQGDGEIHSPQCTDLLHCLQRMHKTDIYTVPEAGSIPPFHIKVRCKYSVVCQIKLVLVTLKIFTVMMICGLWIVTLCTEDYAASIFRLK